MIPLQLQKSNIFNLLFFCYEEIHHNNTLLISYNNRILTAQALPIWL